MSQDTPARTVYFTDFNEQLADDSAAAPAEDCLDCTEFVIPADLSALSVAELEELRTQAMDHFDTVYADGTNFEPADIQTLTDLTAGIEALQAELGTRAEEAAALAAQAAELAAKVKGEEAPTADAAEAPVEGEAPAVTPQPEVVQASGVRVNLSRSQARQLPAKTETAEPKGVRDVVYASGPGGQFADGTGLDWNEVGSQLAHRLAGYQSGVYQNAHQTGRAMQQQFGLITIRKPIPEDLMITDHDAMRTEAVLRHAASESRLPQGSLTASGGWCAPSETMYDLAELESRDGIFSLPEVGIARGGIRRTLGPNFADIYNAIGFGTYSEADDIAGDYDGNGGGSKPCYKVECPDFEEFRLGVDGLCIQAGLLQARAYPEVLARTTRGALVAHDHKMAGKVLGGVITGSTAVSLGSATNGAISPILDAIEMQAEHMRYTNRMARTATIEGVFPYWVRGLVRSDLARRNGVELFDVPDARIDAWFTQRQIAPQYIYNFQDLNVLSATAFTGWPDELKFVMYPAGTWIRGTADIITMDTLYDSTLLGTNDFTALFTEEGWMVVKMNHDSRVVTVPVCPDGTAALGIDMACSTVDLTPTTTTTTSV